MLKCSRTGISVLNSIKAINKDYSIRTYSNKNEFPLTSYMGSKTNDNKLKLHNFIDSRNVTLVTDLRNSNGNYLYDVDGKKYLDFFCNIASLPLGYNHKELVNINLNEEPLKSILINRSALGANPPHEWISEIEKLKNNYCPKELEYIHMGCGCGSGANENAFKASFLNFVKNNSAEYSMEEKMKSVMENKYPGSSKYSILSFTKGFHGRTLGCLSTTRTNPLHKIDIPAFDWPVTDFPMLKYPLNKFYNENRNEEHRCLEMVRDTLKKNKNIAACIVEPIQAEGGDRHASNYFFRELRKILHENKITFIVDEVQTGVGSTGELWGYQHWGLDIPPDIVTFSKKMQIAGYFCKKDYIPEYPYQIYNTWLGDPARIFLTNKIYDVIHKDNLLEKVRDNGMYLIDNLKSIESETGKIQNVRGKGTFIAFDIDNRQEFIIKMMENGINIGGCGVNTVRLRPSLTLSLQESDIFMTKLLEVLRI